MIQFGVTLKQWCVPRHSERASREVLAPRYHRKKAQEASLNIGVREGVQLLALASLVLRELGLIDLGDAEPELDAEFEGAEIGEEVELPANPGDQYVQPYVRDGKIVDGHFRTNADATELNNYSGPLGEHYRRLNQRD